MNDTYLGIDLGTSSMKMVLTDSEKHILGQISEEYEAVQSQNGWSEIDPEIWFQAMRRGMHNIFEDQDPKNLKGIGVTGQMHTLIVMGEDGKPVRPAMMWNDTRTKELLPELKKKILEFPEGEYLSQTIPSSSELQCETGNHRNADTDCRQSPKDSDQSAAWCHSAPEYCFQK